MTLAELESFLSQPTERLKATGPGYPGKKSFLERSLFASEPAVYESPHRRLYLKASPFEQHAVLFEGERCFEYRSHRLEHFYVHLRQLACYLAHHAPQALAGLRRFCQTELAQAHRHYILWECLHLSGSTLATLTGLRRYDEQERVQQDFVRYVSHNMSPSWHSWMDAWNAYQKQQKKETALEL